MAAEIGRDSDLPALVRGTGFGRPGGLDSLAERREAARRRLSSSARTAELVEFALRAFDEAMAQRGLPDHDGSLRLTVRAALTIAHDRPGFDVTVVPAPGALAVHVRHTPVGPEVEVLELPPIAGPDTIDLRDRPSWWSPEAEVD